MSTAKTFSLVTVSNFLTYKGRRVEINVDSHWSKLDSNLQLIQIHVLITNVTVPRCASEIWKPNTVMTASVNGQLKLIVMSTAKVQAKNHSVLPDSNGKPAARQWNLETLNQTSKV